MAIAEVTGIEYEINFFMPEQIEEVSAVLEEKHMDICSFINSRDIAEHLRNIDYDFTLPEAAFIVYQSEISTMDEKFAAWQEMIDKMPDCELEDRCALWEPKSAGSFHQFLRDYMALQKKILKMFYEADEAVYTYSVYATGKHPNSKEKTELGDLEPEWNKVGGYFADLQSAIADYKKEKEDYLSDGMLRVKFAKRSLLREPDPDRDCEITVHMTTDLDVIDVDYYGLKELSDEEFALDSRFAQMWFAFPTPFKRGDIVIDRSCRHNFFSGPFVLDGLLSWDRETLLKNGFSEQSPMVKSRDEQIARLTKSGDTSDMDYYAVYLDADDTGFPRIYNEVFWTYLNLERYVEPLKGMYRMLKPVSSALTYDPEYGGPSIEPELFCSAFQLIMMEQMCKYDRLRLERCLTEEAQELAGLK